MASSDMNDVQLSCWANIEIGLPRSVWHSSRLL